eukprot:g1224.t1
MEDHYTVLLALEDVTKPIFGFLPQLQRSERADNVQIERFRTQDGYVARYLSAGSVVIFRSSLTQGLFAQSLRRTFLRFSVSARHSLAEAWIWRFKIALEALPSLWLQITLLTLTWESASNYHLAVTLVSVACSYVNIVKHLSLALESLRESHGRAFDDADSSPTPPPGAVRAISAKSDTKSFEHTLELAEQKGQRKRRNRHYDCPLACLASGLARGPVRVTRTTPAPTGFSPTFPWDALRKVQLLAHRRKVQGLSLRGRAFHLTTPAVRDIGGQLQHNDDEDVLPVDATPNYYYSNEFYAFDISPPKILAEFAPDATIVFLLREPKSRIQSLYNHWLVSNNRRDLSLALEEQLEEELQFLNGTQNLFDGFVNASGIEDQKCNMWNAWYELRENYQETARNLRRNQTKDVDSKRITSLILTSMYFPFIHTWVQFFDRVAVMQSECLGADGTDSHAFPAKQAMKAEELTSRIGLAECMVFGRPLVTEEDLAGEGQATFLHEHALEGWCPLGSTLEVVVLARVTDFFLGFLA